MANPALLDSGIFSILGILLASERIPAAVDRMESRWQESLQTRELEAEKQSGALEGSPHGL